MCGTKLAQGVAEGGLRIAALAVAVALSVSTPAPAGERLHVIDGDTLRIGGETIRLATIDAPETRGAECLAESLLGDLATRRLEEMTAGRTLTVRRGDPADGRAIDRYGRTLGLVFADGEDVAQALVDEGLAMPWTGRRVDWCANGE